MALTGSYFHIEHKLDNNISESIELQHPIGLPPEDPDYEKRGTTEIVWISGSTISVTEYPGHYGIISTVAVYNTPDNELHSINGLVHIFSSSEHKVNDPLNPLFSLPFHTDIEDIYSFNTGSENIITTAYKLIKDTDPSFVSMSAC